MFNNWLTIGSVTIHGYGVMIAVGVILAFLIDEKLCDKFGLDGERIDTMIFAVLIGGYACSKALYCIIEWETFLESPMSVLGSGGWVVYGGIIGGLLTAYLFCKIHKWNFMDYFNVVVTSVALAQAFGRIGCFFAGCCYGIETDAFFGVTFPSGSLAPAGVKLVPTQLIMSAGDFLIAGICYRNLTKGKHPEDTGALYLILYSVGRFFVEYIRGDLRGEVGVFSTSQFISLFIFVLGAGLINYRQKKGLISPALQKALVQAEAPLATKEETTVTETTVKSKETEKKDEGEQQ